MQKRSSFLFRAMTDKEKKQYNYGGQAVIEGVMIRGKKSLVTAIRRPTGEIITDVKPAPVISQSWARRTPLVRGVFILIESTVMGIKSLLFSANVAMEEEGEEIPTKAIWGMMGVSILIAVGLFFLAPLFLTKLVNNYLPNTFLFAIIEGVIRLVIFFAYLKIVGMMSDIKRVFTYHGAEHKVVNAFEAGAPLEVAAVKPYTRYHVRCGTAFLFLVLIIAIIVFSVAGRPALWIMVITRIVLLPVIMGLGYEVIHFGAKHANNWLMKIVLSPGLLLQAMTTGEPDDKQIEVAIASLKKAVEIDEQSEVPSGTTGPDSQA